MFKLKTIFLVMIMLCVPLLSQAQTEQKSLSLSLEDCIMKAMENNLGVAIEVLGPELADIAIARANEKFMPSLSLSFDKSNTNQASYSWLDSTGNTISKFNAYNANLSQVIPTGGNLSIQLSNSKYDTNRTGNLINPRYNSQLRFNFTQPLLRDFGPKMSRREILVARNDLVISEKDFQSALQETVYSVEAGYWNYVYSIEDLQVQQQSLQLARDLLEKNRRAVEVGTMAPIDVINAQASVAAQEANILAAETSVKNYEDQLKRIINLPAETPEAALLNIIPKDQPVYEQKLLQLDEALAKYKNWSIGFTLDVPLNNIISKASFAQARVNLERSQLQLKNQEQQIFTDIKIAVRNVETAFLQIQARKSARELAEKQLEAEEEKYKVGMSTNYLVLQYQRDLSTAKSAEIRAIIDYNLALAQLNRDLGISLKEKNISISDVLAR